VRSRTVVDLEEGKKMTSSITTKIGEEEEILIIYYKAVEFL
jgi:hypothetical protein